jgi:hypothetical protein
MLDYLENSESLDDFLEGFPTVSRALAIQVLEESKELRLSRVDLMRIPRVIAALDTSTARAVIRIG